MGVSSGDAAFPQLVQHGGRVDPQVFTNVGLDPAEWTGFAFGCGLERTAQLRHDIPDIRALWEGDLRVMRQF